MADYSFWGTINSLFAWILLIWGATKVFKWLYDPDRMEQDKRWYREFKKRYRFKRR